MRYLYQIVYYDTKRDKVCQHWAGNKADSLTIQAKINREFATYMSSYDSGGTWKPEPKKPDIKIYRLDFTLCTNKTKIANFLDKYCPVYGEPRED